jgi:hypothetical protein
LLPVTVAVVNAFKTFRSLTAETRRQLLILFVTALFFWISITTLVPTLPTYIDSLSGSKQEYRFCHGVFCHRFNFIAQLVRQSS